MGRTLLWIATGTLLSLAVGGAISSRVPVSTDEAWFLQVVVRIRDGAAAYREVFFGAGPLPIWLASRVVGVAGREARTLRRLADLYYGMTVGSVLALVHTYGGGAAVIVATAIALFGLAGPAWPVDNHYGLISRLAVALCASTIALSRSGSDPRLAVAVAATATAAGLLAKHSVGSVALLFAPVILVVDAGGVAAAGGFVLIVVAWVAGALAVLARRDLVGPFMTRAFVNKRTFMETGRYTFRMGFAQSLPRLGIGRLSWLVKAVTTSGYVLMAASPVAVGAAMWAWRAGWAERAGVGVVAMLVVAGIACAVPRADPSHVRSAVPLLVAAMVSASVLMSRSSGWPIDGVLGAGFGTAGAVGLLAAWRHWSRHLPGAGPRVPHFAGLGAVPGITPERLEAGERLRARTGGQVFLLRQDAALWYLACGLVNPTPFDYPLASTFGPTGQDDVAADLASGRIPWCCLAPAGAGLLTPRRLESFVCEELDLIEDTALGTLYRTRAAPSSG